MALTWNATKVADYQALHEDKREATKSEYLCWAMMDARIGEITEANWTAVWTRIDLLQRLNGPILRDLDGPMPYTAKDIERRIGYSCNVKTETFRARWYKEFENRVFDNAELGLKKEEVNA